jgi:DNA polymerase III gamma/tau subunit
MSKDSEAVELYRKYRPTALDGIVGQPTVVKMLKDLFKQNKVPHTILLSGASGCGKTSIARIIQTMLKCDEMDFYEINCASERGINIARDIKSVMGLSPLKSPCRVWLLDECHRLTGDALSALLKILEDTPNHVYFILATTDPQKLLKTIITRCTEFKLSALDSKSLAELITSVCQKEQIDLSEEVLDRLVEISDGSARKSLVYLHQIAKLKDEDEQLNCLISNDVKRQAIELARTIMDPRSKWADVSKILQSLDEDPEQLRAMVLGYANKVLLSSPKLAPKAYLVICAFETPFYYGSGRSGLSRACWEVMNST